jgi:glutamate racemase
MIGVFDSGHGGLAVQRHLSAALPDESFLYLGDHAQAPFGNRSLDDVVDLTRAGVERLFHHGCRLVILACNTAATAALRRLQQTWLPERDPARRILGVVVPTIEAITRVPWMIEAPVTTPTKPPSTIGIFGTRHTIRSGAYPLEVAKRAPEIDVIQQACPDLAAAIEQDAPADRLQMLVDTYVSSLQRQLAGRSLDTVTLACTHYPLVEPMFRRRLPDSTLLLQQGELTAASLGVYLARHPQFARRSTEAAGCRFLTTGDPTRINRIAARFLGQPVTFQPA